MEKETKVIAPVAAVEAPVAAEAAEAGDRRSSGLVQSLPLLESFAGWGPRLEGSIRDVLRGLN